MKGEDFMSVTSNLDKGKTNLIIKHPFFATLLLTSRLSVDNRIPTAATNGDYIRYNEKWMGSLSANEVLFTLAHEVLHIAFEHCDPSMRSKDRRLWNMATDFVINQILTEDSVGQAPKGCLLDAALYEAGKGTAEGVYRILEQEKADGKDRMGEALDDLIAGEVAGQEGENGQPLTPEEVGQRKADIKARIAQAAAAARMAGSMSKNMERLVGEVTKPKVDWKYVLRRYMSERVKTEYTFAKPRKRYIGQDLYLPSMSNGDGIGEVAIAIDCSGSICEDILRVFISEICGICEDVQPSKLHILSFDSEVLKHTSIDRSELVGAAASGSETQRRIREVIAGGGGTAFSPIWSFLDAQSINPVACVVLTDLCCSDFGIAPAYPVLWTTTDMDRAPFGEIVKISKA